MNIRDMGWKGNPHEIYSRTHPGRLQCHDRPWWPNLELTLYLIILYTYETLVKKTSLSLCDNIVPKELEPWQCLFLELIP